MAQTQQREDRRYRDRPRGRATKFVDMARDTEEKKEQELAMPEVPDYPYGLCLSLSEDELDKLDLEDDMEAGDIIDLRGLARVTSVSRTETDGHKSCRVELQITHLAVENESTEGPGA